MGVTAPADSALAVRIVLAVTAQDLAVITSADTALRQAAAFLGELLGIGAARIEALANGYFV